LTRTLLRGYPVSSDSYEHGWTRSQTAVEKRLEERLKSQRSQRLSRFSKSMRVDAGYFR
jgi:hypothetical protein